MTGFEQLLDYRRQVARLYALARDESISISERVSHFRAGRDALFASHAQSALTADQKQRFKGLAYFPYNPAFRFAVRVESDAAQQVIVIDLPEEGSLRLERFGRAYFEVSGQTVSLAVYWLRTYGGGIFLPFRDQTSGQSTYGGGRYLLDTIKYSDLGHDGDRLILDFNFAYNPSCAYNTHWVCPLAPRENWLPVSIPAGEKRYEDSV